MAPMLRTGDDLKVSACDVNELKCGDLIVYRGKHGFLTHRILDVESQTVRTKGDAWYKPDTPVSKDDIVGIVYARENHLRLIDFNTPRWGKLNRFLGWLNLKQVIFVDWVEGKRKANKSLNEISNRRSSWLSYPFRIVERIALCAWGYR
jgi:hypothetical protein